MWNFISFLIELWWVLLVGFTVIHYWNNYADRHADVDLDV